MTKTIGKTLLIRTDASNNIGTGHVMRCLALAQAWQDMGGYTIFAMATEAPALEARLREEGMELIRLTTDPGSFEDTQETIDLAQSRKVPWVVVDGYHFDAKYQRRIKDSGLRLLFIDDYGHAQYYWADIVLNQNIHAHEKLYANHAPYTQLLLGTRFVLLRREFLKWQSWKRKIPKVARKVLITMGGTDPENVTLKVIHSLEKVRNDKLEAVVVVGGSNQHYEELELAVQNVQVPIQLKRNVTNMPELITWADVAVSAGSSTVWELAFMGLPIIGLSRAKQEAVLLEGATHAGISLNLGDYGNVEPQMISEALMSLLKHKEQRSAMSSAGRLLVNGHGPARVIDVIKEEQ